MAYVNVAEWKTDQVCEWLKGLDNAVLPYVHSFMNHAVSGQQLLSLRPEDLEHLGVLKLGHQEIVLEAVEYLRNFHYELDRENLQLLALRLSCQAHSLHNELSRQTDSKPVTTQTLSDVAAVVMAVKPLVRWLDRPPFSGQLEYNDKKAEAMKLSLEMATCAQRDRFAEKPIEEIRTTCGQLAKLADYIIQDIADPMILQPASLDLATLKKRPGDDLGFCILPSFHGAHQIAEIKFGSAAHQCGKMEEGDEIVQVNYQTVVGWERKNVLELFRESPAEVLLTLKRRPRHTKVYGQIYIKPYRLPSNKKTPYTTRWQHNLPSPRPELLTIPDFTMPLPRQAPKNPSPEPASILDTANILDTMATDSSDSDIEVEPPLSTRLYSAKPRNLVQRRATITGASPTTKHGIDIEQFWKELKQEHRTTFQLRDKAASCAHGLDNVPSNARPQTCLGIEQSKRKKRNEGHADERKVQFQEKPGAEPDAGHADDAGKSVQEGEESPRPVQRTLDSDSNLSGSPRAADSDSSKECASSNSSDTLVRTVANGTTKELIVRVSKERGKLDKSHSTPAYDLMDSDEGEGRKLTLFDGLVPRVTVSEYKADHCPNDAKAREDAEDRGKSTHARNERDKSETSARGVSGADEDADSRERADCREAREPAAPDRDSRRSVVARVKVNDANYKSSGAESESNSECTVSDASAHKRGEIRDEPAEARPSDPPENGGSNHESSEEKSESVSSYIEGTCSGSSSDGDIASRRFAEILDNIENSMRGGKIPERVVNEAGPVRDDGRAKRVDSNASIDRRVPKCDDKNGNSTTEKHARAESKRLENKPHAVPPEPPPRRYFAKPGAYGPVDNQERPLVPEKPSVRRDLKKLDACNENCAANEDDYHERTYDSYNNFVERSTDFIDDPNAATGEHRAYFCDGCAHPEYSDGQPREERHYERHDPATDRYGNANYPPTEYYRSEYARNVDFLEAGLCPRQAYGPRASEKDRSLEKGVVNRAMMVARSIGLHGSLGKACSHSPRSGRKRNTLLAKKRNVSVRDVGSGELEGWLTYRSRGAGGAWAKAWFVLKSSSLYRFKKQDSPKADCLIALTGFTVSQAAEVKSRKYAFKIYHTGTVFYFAADTEDWLVLWLEAVNKATLGTDPQNRNSGLFSETDESDTECKGSKSRSSLTPDSKQYAEKSFGSLKKTERKEPAFKDRNISGASLDRKYLRFLGARNQNLPVPTAQFRSYRRVLPASTPNNKKQDSASHSPDLQMTIAGSTFYGLSASQSTSDMSNSSQDMGDYRRTTDRSVVAGRPRRTDELQGFVTLEELLAQQEEEQRRAAGNRSASPRVTPLVTDHVHIHHRNFNEPRGCPEQPRHAIDASFDNGAGYGYARGVDCSSPGRASPYRPSRDAEHLLAAHRSTRDSEAERNERHAGKYNRVAGQKAWESGGCQKRRARDGASNCCQQLAVEQSRRANGRRHLASEQCRSALLCHSYSGSSGDLTCSPASETLQRAKKDAMVSRKGSFNLATSRRNDHQFTSNKNWLDSLKRGDKRNASCEEQHRLKNVAQYQPPPMHASPFEQEGMRAAFEMHLDKTEQVQKANRLKSLFGAKCQQKPSTLDLPKDAQKTLLGSPRLHRALFRDKSSQQKPTAARADNQSPADSGISQSLSSFSGASHSQTLSQSFSSASSVSDWSPDTTAPSLPKQNAGHASCQKPVPGSGRNSLTPPTLPYVPPPTSPPPPDYPGLEYPPVFEPGTYSLSDASLMRSRARNAQNNIH